jgi:hypothetical protein
MHRRKADGTVEKNIHIKDRHKVPKRAILKLLAATSLRQEGSRLGLSSSKKMKSRSRRIREIMATMKSPIIIIDNSSRDINPRDKVATRISHMDITSSPRILKRMRDIIITKLGLKCLLTSTSNNNNNINSQDVRMREVPLSKCSRTKGDRWASAGDSIQANPS